MLSKTFRNFKSVIYNVKSHVVFLSFLSLILQVLLKPDVHSFRNSHEIQSPRSPLQICSLDPTISNLYLDPSFSFFPQRRLISSFPKCECSLRLVLTSRGLCIYHLCHGCSCSLSQVNTLIN